VIVVSSFNEVKMVVVSMYSASASGLDGFTGYFFQKCWDILGHDVLW